MNAESIETVIIGAGQAGLATGYHLRKRGRSFVILDGNARIGDQWRAHWDTLRLYTPTKYDGLPGLPFPGEPWTFPTKEEVADYLESYAGRFDLPVRNNTRVQKLESEGGRYVVTTGSGTIHADNVVVATGTFGRTPYLPDFAVDLDPSIRQLHSSEYRRPGQLKDGPVLVVGGGHSGTDIAYEVATTHRTILCGRDPGQIPVRLDSRRMHAVFPVFLFVAKHVVTLRTPIGQKAKEHIRFHGGPMVRVKREDLLARGVERVLDRVTGVRDGQPVLGDDRALDVANVIWATGYRQVFDWVRLPVIGADGWPEEERGVVAAAPGLFFCGLSFQFAAASMALPGVGRDTAYVAKRIAARSTADRSLAAA